MRGILKRVRLEGKYTPESHVRPQERRDPYRKIVALCAMLITWGQVEMQCLVFAWHIPRAADFRQPFPDKELEFLGDGKRGVGHHPDDGLIPGFEAWAKAVTPYDLHHDLGSESNRTQVRFTEACAHVRDALRSLPLLHKSAETGKGGAVKPMKLTELARLNVENMQ